MSSMAPSTGKPTPITPNEFFTGMAIGVPDTVQAVVTLGPPKSEGNPSFRHDWNAPGDSAGESLAVKSKGIKPAYFTLASFRADAVTSWKGRTQHNAQQLPGFFADVEGSAKKYAKQDGPDKGYPNGRAAMSAVLDFVKATGLKPTDIVTTGSGGVHLYWRLTEHIGQAEWHPLAKALVNLAALHGFKIDAQCTTDAARIMRAPGSLHQDTGKEVKAYRVRTDTYSREEFAALVRCMVANNDKTSIDKALEIVTKLKGESKPQRSKTGSGVLMPTHLNGFDPENYGAGLAAHRLQLEAQEPIERVSDALRFINPDIDRDSWLKIIFAIRHGLGDTREAFVLADTWSRGNCMQAVKYTGPESVRAVWDSYDGARDGATTVGTLYHFAKRGGWQDDFSRSPDEKNISAEDSASDLALANIFVRNFSSKFKRDHSIRSWRGYTNGRWAVCTKAEQVEAVKVCVPVILKTAAKELTQNSESVKGKKLMALAARAQSEKGIAAALKLAESDPAVAVTSDQFDCNHDLLNVANGVIDLRTCSLLPHDGGLMLNRQSPVVYDPEAQCPEFLKFIDQISCNDPDWVDYMQRQLGYALCGHVGEEKMFFWYGNGRNGKSVLANVIRHIMGDFSVIAPVSMFMVSRRDGGDATPHLAMLPGKRLMLANETEAGSRMSAQMMKVAISTEHISARPLHGKPFSFQPTHKTIMRGNHLPIIQEGDDGTWRRIDLVPFDLKLTADQCDPHLEQKLLMEAPGILRWMVEGHAKWRSRRLVPAARVRNASNAYRDNSDVIANWLADECEVSPAFEVVKASAYTRYRIWAAAEGLRCMAKKSLTRALAEKGFSDGRQSTGARQEVYRGFKCK